MSKEILVSIDSKGKRVAITKDNRLEEFYVEPNEEDALLGNIYIGKVNSVVPSLGAAFIDIGQKKNGFLYLSDITSPISEKDIIEPFVTGDEVDDKKAKVKELKPDQDIWVQVVKEPFGTKGSRLTAHVSLPGRYLVLMPFDKQIGISRRIEDKSERERLKTILEKTPFCNKMGFIIRTVSSGRGRREILRDASQLTKLWKQIRRFAARKSTPVLVYKDLDLTLKTIRDYFTEDIDDLFTDSDVEFKRMRRYARSLFGRSKLRKLHLYRGKFPLFESKKIEREIGKIYERKVLLKSGAYIVIEKTEGLIVIDVNSGKFKSKSDSEQTAYSVNLEASKEIARQLRLRDYSGIIVIDFIDMMKGQHQKNVLKVLKEALEYDRAKTEVLGISKLGLVEMTRERTGRPVESAYFKICPYCEGSGKIKND